MYAIAIGKRGIIMEGTIQIYEKLVSIGGLVNDKGANNKCVYLFLSVCIFMYRCNRGELVQKLALYLPSVQTSKSKSHAWLNCNFDPNVSFLGGWKAHGFVCFARRFMEGIPAGV